MDSSRVGRRGPRPVEVVLSDEERRVLEGWSRRRSSAQGLAVRARIVLGAADGENNTKLAQRLGLTRMTVAKWRSRFVVDRVDGLLDEPRPGKPRTISDEKVAEVIAATLESAPKDATHWSTRSMAAHLGLSQSAVSRIWRAFGLQPHRVESFKLSTDALFVEKVRDVVGLYLDPPERALVLCVDEKSQIQALDRSQPILPMMPGVPERATHDYKRSGTSSLFAALDIASGKVIGSLHARHRTIEFKKFLAQIDAAVPPELDVHLILDNYTTHKTKEVQRWLLAHPRFHLHFTPTGSSWLNLIERWFAELTNKKLERSAHKSVRELNADIRGWIEHWNENPRPYVWAKTADQIFDSLTRYCQRTTDSGH
jgi:transposase